MASTTTSAGSAALAALTSGTDNTALGAKALTATTTGTENVAVGSNAASNNISGTENVVVGYNTASTLTTGSNNIVIGGGYDVPTSSTSNYLNIGGVITGNMSTGAITLANGFNGTTQSAGDNSTKLATTAYVDSTVSSTAGNSVSNGRTGATSLTAHGVLLGEGTSPIVASGPGNLGQIFTSAGSAADGAYQDHLGALTINADNSGTVLQTGSTGFCTAPFSGVISHWYVAADIAGSCVIDVKRSGSSIVGTGNMPSLSSTSSANAAVSGWTSTTITVGDIIEGNINSASTITRVNVVLQMKRTS